MKLVRQPKDSNLCGQCCVAMIRGIRISTAVKYMRKKGVTNVSHLYKGLGKKQKPIKRFTKRIKKKCILFIKWRGKKIGHWVVFDGKKVFDPGYNKILTLNKYKKHIRDGRNGFIQFYVEVE